MSSQMNTESSVSYPIRSNSPPTHLCNLVDVAGNYSSSSYNAGSIEIRRRFRSGLNFQASYTFSKVNGGLQRGYSPMIKSVFNRIWITLSRVWIGPGRTLTLHTRSRRISDISCQIGKGLPWAPSEQDFESAGFRMDDVIDLHIAKREPRSQLFLSGRGTLNAGSSSHFCSKHCLNVVDGCSRSQAQLGYVPIEW